MSNKCCQVDGNVYNVKNDLPFPLYRIKEHVERFSKKRKSLKISENCSCAFDEKFSMLKFNGLLNTGFS